MYTLQCGCELGDMYIRSWSCGCCGDDYELEDAYITKACESHGG